MRNYIESLGGNKNTWIAHKNILKIGINKRTDERSNTSYDIIRYNNDYFWKWIRVLNYEIKNELWNNPSYLILHKYLTYENKSNIHDISKNGLTEITRMNKTSKGSESTNYRIKRTTKEVEGRHNIIDINLIKNKNYYIWRELQKNVLEYMLKYNSDKKNYFHMSFEWNTIINSFLEDELKIKIKEKDRKIEEILKKGDLPYIHLNIDIDKFIKEKLKDKTKNNIKEELLKKKIVQNGICDILTIDKSLVPVRRQTLNTDNILPKLKDIYNKYKKNHKKKNITKTLREKIMKDLETVISEKIYINDEVKNIEPITSFDDYKKYCKDLYRNMNDLKDIFFTNDIVEDGKTKEIQCIIKSIREIVGIDYFNNYMERIKIKEMEELKEYEKINLLNGLKEIDELDKSIISDKLACAYFYKDEHTYPQCFRFFKEWLEDVSNEKMKWEIYLNQIKDDGKNQYEMYLQMYQAYLYDARQIYNIFEITCNDEKYSGKINSEEYSKIMYNIWNSLNINTPHDIYNFFKIPKYLLYEEGPREVKADLKSEEHKTRRRGSTANNNDDEERNGYLESRIELYKNHNVVPHHINEDLSLDLPTIFAHLILFNEKEAKDMSDHIISQQKRYCSTNIHSNYNNKICICKNKRHHNKRGKGIKHHDIHQKEDEINKWDKMIKKNKKTYYLPEGIYVPKRRQEICTRYFKEIDFSKNNDLKKQLLEVIIKTCVVVTNNLLQKREGGDLHKIIRDIKNCFFDIRDIVIGLDMWENNHDGYVEPIIKKIFEEGKNDMERDRVLWWELHKKIIWAGMINQIEKESKEKEKKQENVYIDISFPNNEMDQFFRWYIEWTEQYCDQKLLKMKELNQQCYNNKKYMVCNKKCRNKCTHFHKWNDKREKEWNELAKKFENMKNEGNYKYIYMNNFTPEIFLSLNCKTCECIPKEGKLFEPNYDEYVEVCKACPHKKVIEKKMEQKIEGESGSEGQVRSRRRRDASSMITIKPGNKLSTQINK